MRTSRFNGRFAPVRIAFPLKAIIITPEMRTPRYFVKRTSSSVPLVPVIHWIMRTLTCLSRKFVRHGWSIQQLHGIIIALVCIVLVSGQPSRKRTACNGELYSCRTRLHSTQQHRYALPRLAEISEIRTLLYKSGHAAIVPRCPQYV